MVCNTVSTENNLRGMRRPVKRNTAHNWVQRDQINVRHFLQPVSHRKAVNKRIIPPCQTISDAENTQEETHFEREFNRSTSGIRQTNVGNS